MSSRNSVLTKIERWIKRFKNQRKEWSLVLKVHPSIAEFVSNGLMNRKRKLMWKYKLKLDFVPDDSCKADEFRVLLKKNQEDITEQFIN